MADFLGLLTFGLRGYLDETGISETAKRLGVTRAALSRTLNGKAAISAGMAVRLSVLLPNTSPQSWPGMQNVYDIWHIQQNRTIS